MFPLLVQLFSNEESTNIIPVPWMLASSRPVSWNRSSRIVAIKLNMPNPFFALALGCAHKRILTREKWGQAPLRATLRDSIARAHAVVVLDKN
jgi:hypothetical protein